MVVCIFGESCTGKTTLANALKERLDARVFSGKDYLRLAKSEAEAKACFAEMLKSADSNLIYVVSEKDQLDLLPKNCLRVLARADIALIKERFAQRMWGSKNGEKNGEKLPPPIEKMLDAKHGSFDGETYDIVFESGKDDIDALCGLIMAKRGSI
ncbi:MAG: hypothetical protein ACOX8S_02505 [Christensenellales bacterium]